MRKKAQIMDSDEIRRALMRIAHEILERNRGTDRLGVIGIRRRGDILAQRIVNNIEKIEGTRLPLGVMDTTLYRDDVDLFQQTVVVNRTEIPFDVDGMRIVLVDDVLYTGRTTRAAMDALMDFGRPASIQLAVLVDRGHRELPIAADYVGKNIPTSRREVVRVRLSEDESDDCVLLFEKEEDDP